MIQKFNQSEIILLNYIHDYTNYSDHILNYNSEDVAQRISEEQWHEHPEMIESVNRIDAEDITSIYNLFKSINRLD